MQRYYSPQTGCTYLNGIHTLPLDAVPISEEHYLAVIGNPPPAWSDHTTPTACQSW